MTHAAAGIATAMLAFLAADSASSRARQLLAWRRGYQCLTRRRCSSSHTYRYGCLLRNPAKHT